MMPMIVMYLIVPIILSRLHFHYFQRALLVINSSQKPDLD